MTAVAFPMVHDTLPLVKSKSYLNPHNSPTSVCLDFKSIERNEIVVFSWPADTVRRFFVKEKGVESQLTKNQTM